MSLWSKLMETAIEEASLAAAEGEVPIGAIIVKDEQVIARDHNRIEQLKDASAHAEMLAIRKASDALKNWRLTDCTLIVTLEPCIMCLGAIRLARISKVVYGAGDSRFGAFGSVVDLSSVSTIGPVPEVIKGIEEQKCRTLIKSFFAERRKKVPGPTPSA